MYFYQKLFDIYIMRTLFCVLCFTLGFGIVNAQKIKIKNGTIYTDNTEFLKYDDEFGNIVISNLNGKEFLTLKKYTFEKARNKNPNNPQDWRYGDTETVTYHVVSFLNFNLEYETDLKLKDLYVAFLKYNLIDGSGEISEENAKKIAVRISKEISGERPMILIAN